MKCRHCSAKLNLSFVDLGLAPPSNAYVFPSDAQTSEKNYPLRVLVCETCWLVQTEDFTSAEELFSADYAYFSGFSASWLAHSQKYVAEMVNRFGLAASSHVVEVASNDGYLLQYVKERGIPCTGIEPTHSTAKAAREKGIEVVEEFFGRSLAARLVRDGKQADLMAANNVLAHVPDINDFVGGFALLLKTNGVATFEFPHLLRLVEGIQFDTIYHEHFSYLSLTAVSKIFHANGLEVFDVEELSTHGGSLRVYAQRSGGSQKINHRVSALLALEESKGMTTPQFYREFQPQVDRVKREFLAFLKSANKEGKKVAAYGAAAKGNTLLNFCGVTAASVEFVVDANPAKQGKLLPGSHVPIVGLDVLREEHPDYVLILPWNLRREISEQLEFTRAWNARMVIAVPHLEVF